MDDRRSLPVHAHPDEASMTGATMVHYVRQGVTVVLVTCTRGELGEIVAPDLVGLRDSDPDGLARQREGELAEALALLGAARHHWLGGCGRWRDSGIPASEDPAAFAHGDFGEVVRAMVEILRAERTQVVAYDANGGYGHPDHIQANRVTMAALEPAADTDFASELGPPWQVTKVYWMTLSRTMIEAAREAGLLAELPVIPDSLLDEEITAVVDGREYRATKVAALAAHRSQVDLNHGVLAVLATVPEFAVESYLLVRGEQGPGSGPYGWESDLFAGVETVG